MTGTTNDVLLHLQNHAGEHHTIDQITTATGLPRTTVRNTLGRLHRDEDSRVERVEQGVYCYYPEITPPEERERHSLDEELFWEGGEATASGLNFAHVADIPHTRDVLLQDSLGRFWRAHLANVVDQ